MMPLALGLILVGVTAAVVFGTFAALRGLLEWRRARWRQRMLADDDGAPIMLVGVTDGSNLTLPLSRRVDQSFEQLIRDTGMSWSAEQALALMALMGVLLSGFLLLWRGDLWTVTLGLVAGMTLPLLVYLVLRHRWRMRLQNQLPDAFFLLARSLRAGETLEQGIETVAGHAARPLAEEFRRAGERIKLGLTVPAALQGMARRLRLSDFNVFVTAVTLHRTVGGNLVMLLDRVASSTRDRNQFRGYVRAATALARITGLFVACAAPVLFLGFSIWKPEFVARFTQSEGGIRALGAAALLEIIGAIWMYLLLRFDY
jgi:tight adherence protein B